MVESAFLSAALGYRLKMAFVEKEKAQRILLEETRKREELANETARLLQQELSIREVQQNISRDLHDDVGASLSSLQIYSELAAKMVDTKPQEARKLLHRIAADASNIIEHMGHIIWAIQPADSPAQSLETRIRAITYDLLSPRGIFARVELDEEACQRCNQPELRRALALMIKESVNNAAKYSEATTVTVRLWKEEGLLMLSVEDDGVGFDINRHQAGNGLLNIRTRAAKLGGNARIISAPGSGTRMECRIPLPIFSDSAHGIKS
jgi:signal transduction histidine kinase